MSNDYNPYTAPQTTPGASGHNPQDSILPEDLKKVEAVAKDAGQFWLAILMCIFCSALGSVLISPWYGIRLSQWYSLKGRYPQLLDPNAPPGSIQKQFQSAQWKLIVGICFGVFILFCVFCFVLLAVAGASVQ